MNEWISVEERLPEAGTPVLISAHGWIDRAELSGGMFWSQHPIFCYGEYGRPDVTHWMPLPDPPK